MSSLRQSVVVFGTRELNERRETASPHIKYTKRGAESSHLISSLTPQLQDGLDSNFFCKGEKSKI